MNARGQTRPGVRQLVEVGQPERTDNPRQATKAASGKTPPAVPASSLTVDETAPSSQATGSQATSDGQADQLARSVDSDHRPTPKVRLDVHGRPKPAMRGWIHLGAAPLALAGGIVATALAPFAALKAACAVYTVASLVLFGNSACYHLGDWSPRLTDLLRRLDHMNIFLLIAGTYTPLAFALEPFWRNLILVSLWSSTGVALIIHLIWIKAPRWLYTIVYIIFGVSGVGFLGLYWTSPLAGPAVVWLIAAGGVAYILGAIIYGRRWPDPNPKVFGFHEVFHSATVAGYSCHMVAIFLVISRLRGLA